MRDRVSQRSQYGQVLPPHQTGNGEGQLYALPSVSVILRTKEELDRLLQTTGHFYTGDHIYVWGGIKYSGIRGGNYVTEYCYVYLPTGMPFGKCANTCTQ